MSGTVAATGQAGAVAFTVSAPAAIAGQAGASALTKADPAATAGQAGANVLAKANPAAIAGQAGAFAWVRYKPPYAVAQAGALALGMAIPAGIAAQAGALAWVSYVQPPAPILPVPNTSPLKLMAADFLAAFQRMMPRGAIWPRDPDAVQTQALAGLMPTYERSTDAANALLIDAFPATAVNLLPEWELTLGLPDPCAGPAPTIAQRQAQVVARLTARGGNMSVAYYENFAATLGYPITIDQFAPARFGGTFGTPLYGEAWAFAWQVNAPSVAVDYLTFGQPFGLPFSTYTVTALQCELNRLSPAHTVIIYNFGD